MKVKLNKDHVTGRAGETVEVPDGIGNYLLRTGVGEAKKSEGVSAPAKKESKPKASKKKA